MEIPEKKKHLFLNFALIVANGFLFVVVLEKMVPKMVEISRTLARVDWSAMFSLGIFVIMIAFAVKIAIEPLFKYLKKTP